jgi:hypothetical protein
MQPALDPNEAELIALLASAQRRGAPDVDPARYAGLDRAAAYRIQVAVLTELGTSAGMLKTAVHADGVGVVAPIYGWAVGSSSGYRLPSSNVVGLEVEVGLVLGHDLSAATDEQQVADAVDHYFVGVEIVGSRFTDRALAGPNGGLADNMSSLGYAIGPRRPTLSTRMDGLEVVLEFAGRQIYAAPAKHGFGTVLASVVAYANSQHPAYPLRAGTIVTTGSLCGLVPTSGTGHVVARLGDEAVELDIV